MTRTIALSGDELAEVRAILSRFLPVGTKVHVFGSRAGGNPKPWSDLDLALECEGGISLRMQAELAGAFDESRLPWRVDIVDRNAVSGEFGRIIDETKVPLGTEQ